MNVSERYDAFQREAVGNIVADFREDPLGRFLLVIPTGGGKTTTAVKAVHALYAAGQLNQESDRVMWVVHREELQTQARASFVRFAAEVGDPGLPGRVDILMLSEIRSHLSKNPDARFAVVDEAHHVAARSYQPLFDRKSLGILGLTATPSRHDGQPLQFARESFSIGFPELVSMGVLLRPNVITIEGGTYDIADIGTDSKALEILNNDRRNGSIVSALAARRRELEKVIIYAATRNHARDLYALIKSSRLREDYESVGLILGDERRRWLCDQGREIVGETREQFFVAQKSSERSILVNVDVLTEGYDDPTVNTIVMARPTSSKLVYMQAIGRAVRIDPANPEKTAFVVEVVDQLPNINYRIDNRWLYSDISDILEPDVLDQFFATTDERDAQIMQMFQHFNVPESSRYVPETRPGDRVTMLLFKVYVGSDSYEHIPIVITNDTRQSAAAFFNYLSTRMDRLHGLDIEQVFRPVAKQIGSFPVLQSASNRRYVFQAMENAWDLVNPGAGADDGVDPGRPWITFISFRQSRSEESLGEDLLAFTADMLNKESVRDALRAGSYGEDFFLVKFPLPLRGSSGVFLAPREYSQIETAVEALRVHASEEEALVQWKKAMSAVNTTAIAVEPRYIQSLTTIVREALDYVRPLAL